MCCERHFPVWALCCFISWNSGIAVRPGGHVPAGDTCMWKIMQVQTFVVLSDIGMCSGGGWLSSTSSSSLKVNWLATLIYHRSREKGGRYSDRAWYRFYHGSGCLDPAWNALKSWQRPSEAPVMWGAGGGGGGGGGGGLAGFRWSVSPCSCRG